MRRSVAVLIFIFALVCVIYLVLLDLFWPRGLSASLVFVAVFRCQHRSRSSIQPSVFTHPGVTDRLLK